MATTQIAVINESSLVTDQDVASAVEALQKQVSGDFAPVWGLDAQLNFFGHGQTAPAESWQIAVLDDPDQANALGYHDLTSAGLPLGKIFVRADLQAGASWTVTISFSKRKAGGRCARL